MVLSRQTRTKPVAICLCRCAADSVARRQTVALPAHRLANLKVLRDRIAELPGTALLAHSPVYETEAVDDSAPSSSIALRKKV